MYRWNEIHFVILKCLVIWMCYLRLLILSTVRFFKTLSYHIYCYAASYIFQTDIMSLSLYDNGALMGTERDLYVSYFLHGWPWIYIKPHLLYYIGRCCQHLPRAGAQGLFPGAGRGAFMITPSVETRHTSLPPL